MWDAYSGRHDQQKPTLIIHVGAGECHENCSHACVLRDHHPLCFGGWYLSSTDPEVRRKPQFNCRLLDRWHSLCRRGATECHDSAQRSFYDKSVQCQWKLRTLSESESHHRGIFIFGCSDKKLHGQSLSVCGYPEGRESSYRV